MPAPPPGEIRLNRPTAAEVVSRADRRVAALAADEHGVLGVGELSQCGLSTDAIQDRGQIGWLHRKHRGVYAVGHPNVSLEGEFLAAVKACGAHAWLSHYAAAALWKMVEWDDRRIEVTVFGVGTRAHSGLCVHLTKLLAPDDLQRHRGIRVTSPVRTAYDLAAQLPYPRLRRAVRQAASLHLLNVETMARALPRLGRRRGARKIRRILAEGPAPTRSVLEDVVLDLIREAGLEPPDVNNAMRIGSRCFVPDFRWPKRRLVVEADGAPWHEHKLAREDDAERQALLEANGDRVLRVTWEQALRRRSQSVARIRTAADACPPRYD
jgi:very-short-patch-repair endonuclease